MALSQSPRQIARRQQRALAKILPPAYQPTLSELVAIALAQHRDSDRYEEVHAYHDSAITNANDTVHTEKAAPVSEWEAIYKGTLEGSLSAWDTKPYILAFYADLGIRP